VSHGDTERWVAVDTERQATESRVAIDNDDDDDENVVLLDEEQRT
jgi:hypothetical protein